MVSIVSHRIGLTRIAMCKMIFGTGKLGENATMSRKDVDHLLTNQVLEAAISANSIEQICEYLAVIAMRKRISRTDLLIPLVKRVLELTNGPSSGLASGVTPPFDGGPPDNPPYWPTTLIIPSGLDGSPFADDVIFRDFSALKLVGYRAGKTNGLTHNERRRILEIFMKSQLHPRIEEIFGDEYGEPLSMKRLMKIANLLASLCRNMKRKTSGDYSTAIENYERDLEFLRVTYFEPMVLRGFWLERWVDTNT